MRKQVKIQDVAFGDKFYLDNFDKDFYTKTYVTWIDNYDFYSSLKEGCFAIIDSHIVSMGRDLLVYIDIPIIYYKDIKVGEKFKIGQNIYLKIDNMMKDRLSTESNPCVCIENSFLYNCEKDISLERV